MNTPDKNGFAMRLRALRRRMQKSYDNYCMHRFVQRKKNARMKKSLSKEAYRDYRRKELSGELRMSAPWIAALFAAILAFLLLLRLMFAGGNLIGRALRGGEQNPPGELQSETQTERIYEEADITIGSTGCMLLHSPFINSYPDEEGNYDFSSIYRYITPYYSKPDFMTCEFEGALGGEELGYSGYPNFHSPDVIIENIRDSGVDLQFLANNHVYDAWSDGFHRTIQVYEELGIAYTGIRKNEEEKRYYIADIKGVRVGFLNYVYETAGTGTNLNGMQLEQEDWELINGFDSNDLDAFYREVGDSLRGMKAEGAEFIIMQLHWGNEYQLQESQQQDEMAQTLCNMGVDAIIGGHPHCEQPIAVFESEDGSHSMFCVFSEGNALSNQRIYLMDEMPTGHTEDGAMITLSLHRSSDGSVRITDVDLLATWVYRYQDESGSKYFILPLDDVGNLEKTTGIADLGSDALDSYERTMEELGPGLEKAKAYYKK